jgi:hypothetical protein
MKLEIIYTNDYALIVSAEVIEKGDFCYDLYGDPGYKNYKFIVRCLRTAKDSYWNKHCKKIIAHRPLTDAPILEGVPLLPEFGESDKAEKLAYNWFVTADKKNTIFDLGWVNIFTAGYNKAKETYKYTEEDLKKALLMKHNALSIEYVIDFLEKEKRPKFFECETTYDCCKRYVNCKGCDATSDMLNIRMKTIINSEDWEELVGRYIYE